MEASCYKGKNLAEFSFNKAGMEDSPTALVFSQEHLGHRVQRTESVKWGSLRWYSFMSGDHGLRRSQSSPRFDRLQSSP